MLKKDLMVLIDATNKLTSDNYKVETEFGEYTEMTAKEYEMLSRLDGIEFEKVYRWDDIEIKLNGGIHLTHIHRTSKDGRTQDLVDCPTLHELWELVVQIAMNCYGIHLLEPKSERRDEEDG